MSHFVAKLPYSLSFYHVSAVFGALDREHLKKLCF
jgi:hypothetical protein